MDKVSISEIEKIIYVIRGHKVMLDSDLARLYGIETKKLNQAIKRNLRRFPEDFMFQLTSAEDEVLRSQFVTSKLGSGGRRYLPYVFTEQGLAMLSSVLNSETAIMVNISIMRIFVKLRSFLSMEHDLKNKVNKLEEGTNRLFKVVFQRLDEIEVKIQPMIKPNRKKIGLKHE